jgi:hypothetical protein
MLRDTLYIIGAVISFLGLVISVLTLLAICVTATVYYFQLKEMQKAAKASSQSADAATRAAESAEESVTLAKESRDLSRLDQRAWVGPFEVTGTPQADQVFKITVSVKNTGKTFAKFFSSDILVTRIGKDDQIPDFKQSEEEYRSASKGMSVSVLPPNGVSSSIVAVKKGEKLTKDEVNSLQSGEIKLFVFGKATYKDIFGCEHWTTYCWLLNTDWQYQAYETYNDADDNQCP